MKPLAALLSLCGDGGKLVRPFSYESETYATDGAIIAWIERDLAVPSEPDLGLSAQKLAECWFSRKTATMLPELPEPITEPCIKCEGSRGLSMCKMCGGVGQVPCRTCGHPQMCKECLGKGHFPDPAAAVCPDCRGEGSVEKRVEVEFGGHKFFSTELRKLSKLVGIRFYFPSKDEGAPIPFEFQGGRGLIQPILHDH